jgi:hypothetical protein
MRGFSLSIFHFFYVYFTVSSVYLCLFLVGCVFKIEGLLVFLNSNSGIMEFFRAVTFVGPFWFLFVVCFSLFCRWLVRKVGQDFVRVAIKRNLKLCVFREIVQFEREKE